MFKLLSTTGEQAIDLQPGRTVVVGRAVTSDVPIYDPTISRRHAELSLTDGGVKVKDVGSSNGTFLNGARVTEAVAAENDVITFGKVAFRVKEVSAPVLRPQVIPPVSSEFPGSKGAAAGTIVRQMPVSVSGGVPAIVTASPSGASHLKVTAQSLEELREKKLELLLEISKELSKQQELDRLLDKIVEFTFQVMNVDRVSILLLEEKTGELVPRISRGRTAQSSASKHVPQSIARRVVEDRVAILSDNTAADERFKGKSILIQSVRSAMCTPLMGTDQKVLGILYVDNLTATHSFSDDDLSPTSSATSPRTSRPRSRSRRARSSWAAASARCSSSSRTSAASRPCPRPWVPTRSPRSSPSISPRWWTSCSSTAARSTSSWVTP